MNQDVRFIEITFENIDYIKIPTHYFRTFELADIRTTVHRTSANTILKRQKASAVTFELEPRVDIDAPQFEGDIWTISTKRGGLFDRLLQCDIVSLFLCYADGTRDEFLVPWEDEENNEFRNRLQHVWLDRKEIFHVKIEQQTAEVNATV